jgi:hypothetical protein
MKRVLFFLLTLLAFQKGFSQSFEGKLTYISKSETRVDTIFVAVRSDSFRIQYPDRTNATLFIYFVGQNNYAYYSKRDDAFVFNSLSERNSRRQVFTYNTVSVGDTLQLNYLANVPAPEDEVSEVGATIYLDKQLPIIGPIDTLIDYYLFNGSGYVAKEGYNWFKYRDTNKKFHFKLIHVDHTKPDIELFRTEGKKRK